MSTSTPNRSIPFREMILVLIGTSALFLLLAIASYSPNDPSFNYTGNNQEVSNLVGSSGAFFADIVLFLFGWMAYLLPLALVYIGLHLLLSGRAPSPPLLLVVRTIGWVGLMLCACILLDVHAPLASQLPSGSGGVFGFHLAQQGEQVFGWVGMTVLCLAGVIIGLQAAVGFSWLDVAELIGRVLTKVAGALRDFYDVRYDRYQARRAVAKTVKQEADETKALVKQRKVSLDNDQRASDNTAPSSVQILATAKAEKPPSKLQQKRLFDSNSTSELPDVDLLDEKREDTKLGFSPDALEAMSKQLELKLADFGVQASVVSVLPGPVITRFEVQPAAGVKVQKISALAKDLARSMAVISVRIVEVIPGKSVVGIEIPNEHREMVQLKEVIHSSVFQDAASTLTLALGKDISGATIVADIAKMPHLLVAGTTGSGKSVGVNAMLLSILMKATPEQVRLIMVDPKMLELSIYEGIPHLLTPVVTDMKEAAHALNWCVAEMERRYKLMAAQGVRNLAGFNKQVNEAIARGEPIKDPLWKMEDEEAPDLVALPTIVVVIDEFADMMMVVGKKVEQLIARIAQKARAAGIHLILATQRPSVDVITGLIKANIPTRIGFQVSSRIDSRTILDQGGAEQLLGHGDMLYLPPGTALPQRVHGAFVSDEEVHRVVEDWKRRGAPNYLEEITAGQAGEDAFVKLDGDGDTEQEDNLYDEAVQFVLESRRASISSVQRKLRIGYNRAARLIEAMEAAGVVSAMGTNGSREILVPNRD
ncbi:MAG: DNA translocase FtsK 4TM domain-containing protein [Pseudomonadales bacterium]|nr:DNA translocase FtsK 4TM domain-containing protein [Pseudomonadales bacterium]